MIWLSSFPRSGNTFLRNILFEVYGLESSTFHRESSYPVDKDFRDYPFVKTHELPSSLSEFESDIPCVYLVRDGRDAICSIAHHRTDLVAPGSDYEQNLKEAIVADQGSFFGGWSRNAEEWLERADLIIRYEDLIRDPIATVEKLRAVFPLGQPIVENLPTFKSLKFGIPKYGPGRELDISERKKKEQASKFFRRGKSGSWKEDIPEYLQDLFWSYHGDTMERYGYSYEGGMQDLRPEFDSALQTKLGIAPDRRPQKKYRVLIESNKLVAPDNDGVKRYQVELLKSLFPVVENPDSNWEIDLYIHGEITPLLDYKDLVYKRFIPQGFSVLDKLIAMEQKLVALVPGNFMEFLDKNNITVFHAVGRSLRRLLIACVELLSFRGSSGGGEFARTHSNDADNKLDSYDLVHIPLKQHYAPFLNIQSKMLITIHDLTHLHFPEFHTGKNISNADEGMEFAIDKKAHLIAISQSTENDILAATPIAQKKVHLIYEAADRAKFNFKGNGDDCNRVRKKYKLDFSEPYIICLSTLEPRKNLKNTIEAYILLRRDNPDIPLKLVIAGKKGWNVESIYSAAEDYSDHIFFTGFVDDDDLAYLYSGAVAMSYLSFYEGFGLPPLEAMCCGIPIIFGNSSSLVEVVGEGGLAADPHDVNDIKDQYSRMFYDVKLRDRKSRAALRQSLKFSWRDTAIKTLDLYKKIIDDKV